MLYLLDASVLITAHTQYYPIDRIPEFWEWLRYQAADGLVKIPAEIFEEIKEGPTEKDLLFEWISEDGRKADLILGEAVDPGAVRYATVTGYASNLTEDEVDQIGRDPFLIASAMVSTDRCVVTVETSQPKKQRANRKIPDVCKSLGVRCCDPFEFTKALDFSTGWKAKTSK